jgi:hypothetical protein
MREVAMRGVRTTVLVAAWLGLGLGLGLGAAPSAQEPPERVRGILETVKGDQLSVQTREGGMLDVKLKKDSDIFVVTPKTLDDIKAGDFIGITSIEMGGKQVALEAHLFAEDLRGVGEGHYPWDLVQEPNMMTNATIAEIKDVGDDRELEVTYAEGEGEQKTEGSQTIFVPPDVPVVLIEQRGSPDMLTPGKAVFLMVEASDTGPQAIATVVGEGIDPPM